MDGSGYDQENTWNGCWLLWINNFEETTTKYGRSMGPVDEAKQMFTLDCYLRQVKKK